VGWLCAHVMLVGETMVQAYKGTWWFVMEHLLLRCSLHLHSYMRGSFYQQ
jgi:hypothetical protein